MPHLARLKTFVYVQYVSYALPYTHTIRWEAQYAIPSWLLDSLRKQSKCRLFIRLPYGSNTAQAIAKLCGLPQLYSLEVTLANTQHQALAELDRLLSQGTSLSSLSIHWCSLDWSPSNQGRSWKEFRLLSCTPFSYRSKPKSRIYGYHNSKLG